MPPAVAPPEGRHRRYGNAVLLVQQFQGAIREWIPMHDLVTRLEQAIGDVANQYHRLVLLVGSPVSGKTTALQSVAMQRSCPLLNVNLELSRKLLELTRAQRSRQVERLFREMIALVPGDVLLLDNLEILFDTALELHPLRLLQMLDRNRTVVATWNGSFQQDTLIYAEPEHPEYIQIKQPEAVIVAVGGNDIRKQKTVVHEIQ